MAIHTVFDFLASLSALTLSVVCYRWRLRPQFTRIDDAGLGYGLSLVAGAALGGGESGGCGESAMSNGQ